MEKTVDREKIAALDSHMEGIEKMDNYQKYEEDCSRIRESNKTLLTEFAARLESSGLSDKTINKHVFNIDIYINKYLLYEEAREAQDCACAVDTFLGYWFIKKTMWASRASLQGNAVSLKKFYAFLHEKGLVSAEDLAGLHQTIRQSMPKWLKTLDRYDNLAVRDVWR